VSDIRRHARETKKKSLRALLTKHEGNIASAARELDIPRTTLVSQLKKHLDQSEREMLDHIPAKDD
jgi:transcriptional regulator of acetoin/glycerol metabolism